MRVDQWLIQPRVFEDNGRLKEVQVQPFFLPDEEMEKSFPALRQAILARLGVTADEVPGAQSAEDRPPAPGDAAAS